MESATQIFEVLSRDFAWTLVTNRESLFTERWRKGGANVALSPVDTQKGRVARLLSRLRWSAVVAEQILRRRPVLVHANDIRAYQAAALPARLARTPLLFTIRDTKAEGEPYGRHWRLAARQARALVTLSDEMRDIVVRRIPVPADKVVTVNSIVDLQRYAPLPDTERQALRRQLGIVEGQFAVGVVGAIQDKKEQLALIRGGLAGVLANKQVHVHFLGDFQPDKNAYAAACGQAVKEQGLASRVSFHGHAKAVSQWYQALDCVVIASRREGLARCMIEAMACGTPVISFAVCSAREMLEPNGAGRVVPIGAYSALTDEVSQLIQGGDRLRLQMGACGRAVAEQRFSGKRIADAYRSLYQSVQR
jgi:glycosyltransferase involved in cell wall biosynthesis